jgi:hypothetical protein
MRKMVYIPTGVKCVPNMGMLKKEWQNHLLYGAHLTSAVL